MSISRRLSPLLLVLAAAPAWAQYEDPAGENYAQPVEENISYSYAQVLRADEVTDLVVTRTPEERCDEPGYREPARTTGSTVIGAIVGAALGNQIGKGNGRKAATVAGAVAGGAVGHTVASNRAEAEAEASRCRIVEVERQETQVVGYDVEYMYKGEKYMSRLPYDPGNRLRIRVSVTPDSISTAGR